MRRILTVVLLACAVSLATRPAQAQTAQRFSVQASGLYTGLYGSAFEGIKGGIGGEAQIRYTPSALSIGGGVQYTLHNTSGDFVGLFSKVKLLGFFIEPRYVIDAGSESFAPYLSMRLALSNMSFDLGPTLTGSGLVWSVGNPTGPTVNGGGGVLIRLSGRANLDLGVTYGYTKFKDITITATNPSTGQTVSEQAKIGSGTNAVVRVGFALGIGG